MNESNFILAVRVGMGVNIAWRTVSRPSRVSYPRGGIEPEIGNHPFQLRYLAYFFVDMQFLIGDEGDSRRIISTVLQTLQSVNKDRNWICRTDVANYTAHSVLATYRTIPITPIIRPELMPSRR